MNPLFNKYQNIMIFSSKKYRNFTLKYPSNKEKNLYVKPYMNKEEFIKAIQDEEFILINGVDNTKGEKIYLLIIKPGSKYGKQTAQINKIVKKIKREPSTIYIFTKEILSVYIRKSLKTLQPTKFKNYLYKHFIIEIDKGPLCGLFNILTEEETQILCRDKLFISRLDLPRIYNSDPQILWIGAEVGQIVSIRSKSIISGIKKTYRIVYPEKNW